MLFFRERSYELLELFQSGNRLRNRIGLAEVGNAELVVSLRHSRVVLDGFLESIGGFLRPAAVCQNRAKIVIALARARRIQLSGFLQSLRGVIDLSGVTLHDTEIVVVSGLIGFQFDRFAVGSGGVIVLLRLRIGIGQVREDHMLRRIFVGGFFEEPNGLVVVLCNKRCARLFE